METPSELLYSQDHEWVRRSESGDSVRVGITDFAQDALGDVVYVEVAPVGAAVGADETMGEIESTKSVNDLFAPISGEITEVNAGLDDSPQLVNEDPYGEGWICVISVNDASELDRLKSAADYESFVSDA